MRTPNKTESEARDVEHSSSRLIRACVGTREVWDGAPTPAGLFQGPDDHSSKENYGQLSFDNLATDPDHLGLLLSQEP